MTLPRSWYHSIDQLSLPKKSVAFLGERFNEIQTLKTGRRKIVGFKGLLCLLNRNFSQKFTKTRFMTKKTRSQYFVVESIQKSSKFGYEDEFHSFSQIHLTRFSPGKSGEFPMSVKCFWTQQATWRRPREKNSLSSTFEVGGTKQNK